MTLLDMAVAAPSAGTVFVGFVTLLLVLRYASGRKLHPNEPTVLPPWVPFVGHLLGMAIEGGRYIKRIG